MILVGQVLGTQVLVSLVDLRRMFSLVYKAGSRR